MYICICIWMKKGDIGTEIDIYIWVVVKIMVPLWIPIMIRPLIFRVPKKGP